MVALPGASGIAIGDPSGHVHVLPTGAGLTEVKDASEDVSFIGHNAEILLLSADRSGRLIASAATDNSIRVWDAGTGQPMPYLVALEGDAISGLSFSPDTKLLAVLKSASVTLLSTSDGSIVAEMELGELHRGLAFASNDRIVVGGDSGALRLIVREGDGAWSIQQPWKGSSPIRQIEASPNGQYLILVDDTGLASQFVLEDGRVGLQTLAFPGPVEEIAFSRSGSRAFFRTSRWTHRVSVSGDGLHWVDSVFSPKPLNGARIVFGPAGSETANRAYLPAARNGFVELVELAFPGASNPGLFGNREELLAEWRVRLGRVPESKPID